MSAEDEHGFWPGYMKVHKAGYPDGMRPDAGNGIHLKAAKLANPFARSLQAPSSATIQICEVLL